MEQERQRKNGHPPAAVDREDATPGERTLSPERLRELRRMIEAREYDRPEMIDEVARRILVRGDL
jgi:hypothetical protein